MDVMRLDGATYLPNALVEGYKSMIWTERHQEAGEFELKTSLIEETREQIPEGSLLTLRDSLEVMVVETHSIDASSDGATLTVTGRSLETFAEQRVMSSQTYGQPWPGLVNYNTAETLELLLWTYLVNPTNEDPTANSTIPSLSVLNAVPNVIVTDSVVALETGVQVWFNTGQVYDQFMNFIKLGSHGVRTIRPCASSADVISFDVTHTATRGTPLTTPQSGISALRFDIYDGVDRTKNQTAVAPVIFSYAAGDIKDPSYLFSLKDYKTMAQVTMANVVGTIDVWDDSALIPPDHNASGFNRRILYLDGGDQGGLSYNDFVAAATQQALVELKKHNWATIFDGAISPISNYRYNKDYFLGDRVSLVAEYGFEGTMLVSEYVRTEDTDGEQGYPTLVLAE